MERRLSKIIRRLQHVLRQKQEKQWPLQKLQPVQWHIVFWKHTILPEIWSSFRLNLISWLPMISHLSVSSRQHVRQDWRNSRFLMYWQTATIVCVRLAEPSTKMTTCLDWAVQRDTAESMYRLIRQLSISLPVKCLPAVAKWSLVLTPIHVTVPLVLWLWARAVRSW